MLNSVNNFCRFADHTIGKTFSEPAALTALFKAVNGGVQIAAILTKRTYIPLATTSIAVVIDFLQCLHATPSDVVDLVKHFQAERATRSFWSAVTLSAFVAVDLYETVRILDSYQLIRVSSAVLEYVQTSKIFQFIMQYGPGRVLDGFCVLGWSADFVKNYNVLAKKRELTDLISANTIKNQQERTRAIWSCCIDGIAICGTVAFYAMPSAPVASLSIYVVRQLLNCLKESVCTYQPQP